jgi:ribosomal protein S5
LACGGGAGAWVSDCGAVNDVFANHNYTKTPVETVKAVMDAGLNLNCGNFLQDNLGERYSLNGQDVEDRRI